MVHSHHIWVDGNPDLNQPELEIVYKEAMQFARGADSYSVGTFRFPQKCTPKELSGLFLKSLCFMRSGFMMDNYIAIPGLTQALSPVHAMVYGECPNRETYIRNFAYSYLLLLQCADMEQGFGETARFFLTRLSEVMADRYKDESLRLDLRRLSSPEDVQAMLQLMQGMHITNVPDWENLLESAVTLFERAFDPSVEIERPAKPEQAAPALPASFNRDAEMAQYPNQPPEFRKLPGEKVALKAGNGEAYQFILHRQGGHEYVYMKNGMLLPREALEARLVAYTGRIEDFVIAANDPEMVHLKPVAGKRYKPYEPLQSVDGQDLTQWVPPICLGIDQLTNLRWEDSDRLLAFVEFIGQKLESDAKLRERVTPYISRKLPPLGSLTQEELPSAFDLVTLYRYYQDGHHDAIAALVKEYGGDTSIMELLERAAPRLEQMAPRVEQRIKDEFVGKTPAPQFDPVTGKPIDPEYVLTVGGSGVGKDQVQEEAKLRCADKGGLVVASLDAQRGASELYTLLQRVGFHCDDYKVVENVAQACRQGIMVSARGYNLLRDCSGTPYKRELNLILEAIKSGREVFIEMVIAPMFDPSKEDMPRNEWGHLPLEAIAKDAAGRTLLRLYDYDEKTGDFTLREDGRGLIVDVLQKKHAHASREGLLYRGKILKDLAWICAEQGIPFDPCKVHYRAIDNSGAKDAAYVVEHWVTLSPEETAGIIAAKATGDANVLRQRILDREALFFPETLADKPRYTNPDNLMSATIMETLDDGSSIVRVAFDKRVILNYAQKARINPGAKGLQEMWENDVPHYIPALNELEAAAMDPQQYPHLIQLLERQLSGEPIKAA